MAEYLDIRVRPSLGMSRPSLPGWVRRAPGAGLGALGVLLGLLVAAGASARSARSAVTVTAALLCAPLGVFVLVGLGWALLLACPTLLMLDHLTGD